MATCDLCCNLKHDGLPYREKIDGVEHGLCRQCGTKKTPDYWKSNFEFDMNCSTVIKQGIECEDCCNYNYCSQEGT